MKAIVLAAGTGSRLGNLTKDCTKGMVSVRGKKLIDYLLDFLDLSWLEEVVVVGGFGYQELEEHLLGKKLSNLKILENKDFLKGNIYTLITGLKEIKEESFLITNVDHIYPSKMFVKMKEGFKGITGMCDFDRSLGADDMKVELREDQKKIRNISKKLTNFQAGYIGMTYVDSSCLNLYKDALDKALQKYGDKAVVENILQILAEDEKNSPQIFDLSGFGWYEVDDSTDLAKAESGLLKDPNFS